MTTFNETTLAPTAQYREWIVTLALLVIAGAYLSLRSTHTTHLEHAGQLRLLLETQQKECKRDAQISALTSENEGLQKLVLDLNRMGREQERKDAMVILSLTSEKASLQKTVLDLGNWNQELETRAAESEAECRRRSVDALSLTRENEDLQKRVLELGRKSEELEGRMSEREAEVRESKRSLEMQGMHLKTLKAHCQRAESEKNRLQTELETRMAQFKAEQNKSFLKREITLTQRLEAYIDRTEELEAQLERTEAKARMDCIETADRHLDKILELEDKLSEYHRALVGQDAPSRRGFSSSGSIYSGQYSSNVAIKMDTTASSKKAAYSAPERHI